MGKLSWHIDREHPVTVLRLAGQLRLPGVPTVRGLLLKCLAECPAGVVVDLTHLTVTRPLVLSVFPSVLHRAATWPAIPVVLAAPNEATGAALRRTTVARSVPVRPTVGEAIAAAATGTPLGRVRLHLRPTLAAAADAREFTREACAAWGLDTIADEAAVVVTELTDNAARHAATELAVTLAYRGVLLHVAVHDGTPEPPRRPTGEPVPARGLRLVDAFATAWGTLPTEGGKTTWATIRVP